MSERERKREREQGGERGSEGAREGARSLGRALTAPMAVRHGCEHAAAARGLRGHHGGAEASSLGWLCQPAAAAQPGSRWRICRRDPAGRCICKGGATARLKGDADVEAEL